MSHRNHRSKAPSSQSEFCSVSTELTKLESCIRSAIKPDGDFAANVELGQAALDLVRKRNSHIHNCSICQTAEAPEAQ